MSDWSPKYGGLSAGAVASSKAIGQSTGEYKAPEAEVPAIGDTVRIVATPYNHMLYVEGAAVQPGSKIIELEVKAIKNAKVIFE